MPYDEELEELAHLAERGVHPPEEMPFFTAWTDGIGKPGFVDGFVAFHHAQRRDWEVDHWHLILGTWAGSKLIGTQGIEASEFRSLRAAETGSWLGQGYQGNGYGTEMRAAMLALFFRGLGGEVATSGALDGNVASARVSQKLGYELAGEALVAPRGEPVREQKFRLTRERWESRQRPRVELEGLEPCLPLFGV